ncbi:MAG: ATP-binding protein [Myxococcota bacterium]
MVDDLAPWISIALGNTRSFTLLSEYRDQLSQKVEERTRELNEAMEKLAESIRRRTEFFDNVSHELRTPLTLILLGIESLHAQGDEAVSPQVRAQLAVMQQSATRLLQLINDLLDLAKIGAGRMTLHREPVDVGELLGRIIEPFRVMAEHKGLGLVLEGEAGDSIFADVEKVETVFHNLVSNALKFTSAGEVRVRMSKRPDGVCVDVSDTGSGIAAADLPHIFDRFAQADVSGTRRFGGTGIGLALVKETVELHGGSIEVESTLGRGSIFKVQLPKGSPSPLGEEKVAPVVHEGRPRTVAEVVPLQVAQPEPFVAQPDVSFPTVLVVEDEAEVRKFLRQILSERYRVIEAENGEQGLRLAQAERPAVIVSDVMMPVMSGLQLLTALQAAKELEQTPIILLTARHDIDARVEGFARGASDYLCKPFASSELLARVDNQLRLREAMSRLAQTERLAVMSLLTSGFAHEVRNPLNSLINAIEPLAENLRSDPQMSESMLGIIRESAKRVQLLAESLLSMVRRIGDGPADVVSTLRVAQRALAFKVPAGVALEVHAPEEAIIFGDASALTQVWVNLLDNALRAVGAQGTVQASVQVDRREVVVKVTDDGPGISKEHLHRLFEPFFSTRQAGEGTGLGLVLCKRIVEQHRGHIDIQSHKGQGTVCTVHLPRVSARDEGAPPEVKPTALA